MQKKIENYIHHYLGCEVIRKDEIWQLKSVEIGLNTNIIGKIRRKQEDRQTWDLENFEFRNGEIPIKPILRPLSDMTEDEFKVVCKIVNWNEDEYDVKWFIAEYQDVFIRIGFIHSFELTKYLLEQSFDLFGLIKDGLAIDRSKLN